MKNLLTQFIKIEFFSSPLTGILFIIANILGIIIMFMSGFHPTIVWLVIGPLILIWGAIICDFLDKVCPLSDSKSGGCPHCHGEIEVIDETINLLTIQKKIVKKCKKCGKEFEETAHYLD